MRVVGFILFFGGLINALEQIGFTSVYFMLLGAVLLFTWRGSLYTLGFGIAIFALLRGLYAGFAPMYITLFILGLLFILPWNRSSDHQSGWNFGLGTRDKDDPY